MKIVYYHCHEILTYNEVGLLRDLGHQVKIGVQNPNWMAKYPSSSPFHLGHGLRPPVEFDNFELEDADACIFTYYVPQFEHSMKEYAKGKKIFWRFIGQSNSRKEQYFQKRKEVHNLKLIRYSGVEQFEKNFAGCDSLIRFSMDSKEYCGYTGTVPRIALSCNNMLDRRDVCSSQKLLEIVDKKEHIIFGNGNSFSDSCIKVSYSEYKKGLSTSRLFLTAGTIPASYTLGFMEALMTGIPVVVYDNGHPLSEMRSIITHGVNGFVSNNVDELREICDELLAKAEYAKEIGEKGRKTAINLFDISIIKEQWKQLLSK